MYERLLADHNRDPKVRRLDKRPRLKVYVFMIQVGFWMVTSDSLLVLYVLEKGMLIMYDHPIVSFIQDAEFCVTSLKSSQ